MQRGLLRQTFDWSDIETTRGALPSRRPTTRYVADAAGAGIEVLPILFNPPGFYARGRRRAAGGPVSRRGPGAMAALRRTLVGAATAPAAPSGGRTPTCPQCRSAPGRSGTSPTCRSTGTASPTPPATCACCAASAGRSTPSTQGGGRHRRDARQPPSACRSRATSRRCTRRREGTLRHARDPSLRRDDAGVLARRVQRAAQLHRARRPGRADLGHRGGLGQRRARQRRDRRPDAARPRWSGATLRAAGPRRHPPRVRGVVYFNWRDAPPTPAARTSGACTPACCASTAHPSRPSRRSRMLREGSESRYARRA